MTFAPSDGSALRYYLRVLWRRLPIILICLPIVPALAVALSLRQLPRYEASAEVLLQSENLAAGVAGIPDLSAVYQDAARVTETQARSARAPRLAERVLRAANVSGLSSESFLANSSVTSDSRANVLRFRVTDPSAALAVRLAAAYADQFIEYRRELDTAALAHARSAVRDRITELQASGFQQSSPLLQRFIESEQRLRTLEELRGANSSILSAPTRAEQTQPQLLRNGLLGVVLGAILALGAALLREALDTRTRSAEDVAEQLGLPLLARIPEPPRKLRKRNQLAMLHGSGSAHAEAFRVLRTNIEFANLERGARSLLITSALESEGKSTTSANLALALALAGRRVVLVDLDLRRPILDRLFGLEGRPGLTDVARGNVSLDTALVPMALTQEPPEADRARTNGDSLARHGAVLHVLPAGSLPPDPGEFASTYIVGELLARIAERADLVLIDSPPLLDVGDAIALSAKVDGLVLVTRLSHARRSALSELRRVLAACPASKLGFVLTGAEDEERDAYAVYSYPYRKKGAARPEVVMRVHRPVIDGTRITRPARLALEDRGDGR